MLTLFCAVVRQEGSEFAVEIDESECVGVLKDATKNEQMYEFPSSKLQLLLGKQSNGMWLDSSAVDAVTTDANGHPEGFMHMDQLLLIKNPRYFGERFEFKEEEIHVLVVVPENVGKIPSQASRVLGRI
jgi:Crinkler effector protein N-terminal domain